MSDPYIGEIRIVGFNFAPIGWAFCNGQVMPINQNDALFAPIGTTYGGDGQTTFALPDFRGWVPIHQGMGSSGTTHIIGESSGTEAVTPIGQEIPVHSHRASGSTAGTQTSPANGVWAMSGLNQFSNNPANANMNPQAILPTGGGQPYDNMMPFLTVSFVIAREGIFPTQG